MLRVTVNSSNSVSSAGSRWVGSWVSRNVKVTGGLAQLLPAVAAVVEDEPLPQADSPAASDPAAAIPPSPPRNWRRLSWYAAARGPRLVPGLLAGGLLSVMGSAPPESRGHVSAEGAASAAAKAPAIRSTSASVWA